MEESCLNAACVNLPKSLYLVKGVIGCIAGRTKLVGVVGGIIVCRCLEIRLQSIKFDLSRGFSIGALKVGVGWIGIIRVDVIVIVC